MEEKSSDGEIPRELNVPKPVSKNRGGGSPQKPLKCGHISVHVSCGVLCLQCIRPAGRKVRATKCEHKSCPRRDDLEWVCLQIAGDWFGLLEQEP